MKFIMMPKRIVAFSLALIICVVPFLGDEQNFSGSIVCSSIDVSGYAERLKEISKEQEKLDKQIKESEKNIKDQNKKQELIKKKIDTVNEKISTLNSYMTQLEIKIESNNRKLNNKKKQIENNVDQFKERLRATYLLGEQNTYISALFESGDFYEMLMRIELIKRVAKYDNDIIDNLIEQKNEYENVQKDLNSQKEEYNANLSDLTSQRKELDKLYNSSEKLREEYENKKKELEEANKKYKEEREAFEADIASLLSSGSKDVTSENAELLAKEVMSNADTKLSFGWPVPGNYNVTSGVGPRWGTQHNGMDISGSKGTAIHSAEEGKVLIASQSCPHNYGKNESCGCGHGYGNYVLIQHSDGFATLYGHMTSVKVNVGDIVKKGQQIGTMGSTGYSTGNHLHFEVRFNGIYVNPATFVNM